MIYVTFYITITISNVAIWAELFFCNAFVKQLPILVPKTKVTGVSYRTKEMKSL